MAEPLAFCNEHGVYPAQEELRLSGKGRGAAASIELADLGTHWIWATGFQLFSGDCWGSAAPLVDRGNRAPSREEAIKAAAGYLRDRLTPRAESCADARAILAWLEGVVPDQLDLFGGVAA